MSDYKNAIIDAVLIVNWALTQCEEHTLVIPPHEPETLTYDDEYLRRVQTQLLEAYRVEMNYPWSRYYESKPQNSTFGRKSKAAKR